MEFMIPYSPVSIFIACLFLLFVVSRITSDYLGIRRAGRLNQALLEAGKLYSQQPVTVLIELSRRAETIIPLLDALYAQKYQHLQVIIIIKPPARQAAQSKLARYRRRNKVLGLRLVSYIKGQTTLAVLRRYASGAIVIRLAAEDHPSPDFFAALMLDFLNPRVSVVVPTRISRLDATITTGLQEHYAGIMRMKTILWPHVSLSYLPLCLGVAYRLRTLLKPETRLPLPAMPARSVFITSRATKLTPMTFMKHSVLSAETQLKKPLIFWGGLIAVAFVFGAVILFSPQETSLLLITLSLLYVVMYALAMVQTRGYRLLERVNLLLLAPVGLAYAVIVYAVTLSHMGWVFVTTPLGRLRSHAL